MGEKRVDKKMRPGSTIFWDYIFLDKIIIILINLRSTWGQSFTNSAEQMNVLYSAEQKSQPLGSQALPDTPLFSDVAGKFIWYWCFYLHWSWELVSPVCGI